VCAGEQRVSAAHHATSLDGVLGVVEDAWLTTGAGHARVRFSTRPKAAEIFADVKAAIIRNVSVGYIMHEAEELDGKRGAPRVVRATRWEPLELSLVRSRQTPGQSSVPARAHPPKPGAGDPAAAGRVACASWRRPPPCVAHSSHPRAGIRI
jgi:hypothetical protein